MEDKLESLKTDKHELFLQLKKVLNEDENRRRQMIKEKKWENKGFYFFIYTNISTL